MYCGFVSCSRVHRIKWRTAMVICEDVCLYRPQIRAGKYKFSFPYLCVQHRPTCWGKSEHCKGYTIFLLTLVFDRKTVQKCRSSTINNYNIV